MASTGYFMQVAEATERSSAKMWAAVATVPPERAPIVATTGWTRKFDALTAVYSAGAAADEVVDGSLELVAQIRDLVGVPVLGTEPVVAGGGLRCHRRPGRTTARSCRAVEARWRD